MEDENNYIDQFKKSKKPGVPDGFFENFYHSLIDELEAADVFTQFNIKKSQPTTQDINLHPIVVPKRRKTKVIRMTFVATVTSIAAVFAILVYTNNKSNKNEIVADQKVEENYDNYLAYVDESTLVDYIIENEVNLQDDYEDALYEYVEDDIEDIYLDL